MEGTQEPYSVMAPQIIGNWEFPQNLWENQQVLQLIWGRKRNFASTSIELWQQKITLKKTWQNVLGSFSQKNQLNMLNHSSPG